MWGGTLVGHSNTRISYLDNDDQPAIQRLLAAGYWLLAVGCWLLVVGYSNISTAGAFCRLLAIGIGCSLFG